MVSNPMYNVRFTAVTNYIQYIRQDQPEVSSEQSQYIPLSQRQLRTKVSQSMAVRRKVTSVTEVRWKYRMAYNSSYAN